VHEFVTLDDQQTEELAKQLGITVKQLKDALISS